jgi:hypothetical protein
MGCPHRQDRLKALSRWIGSTHCQEFVKASGLLSVLNECGRGESNERRESPLIKGSRSR